MTEPKKPSLLSRTLLFAYGVLSYAVFLGVFLYAVAFLGNFYIPRSIDADPTGATWRAVVVDTGLLALFAVQHSVMARPAFKRWWTRFVPPAAERSTYVLFSNLAMIALFVFWRPIGGVVWDVSTMPERSIIYAFYFLGWGVLFYATCLINHFDLFGLRQIWMHLRGLPETRPEFRTPGLYKLVRHPIYLGWLMIFWFTPTMTVAHLLFAVATTAYIFVGIRFEEKDLVDELGEDYENYRKRVRMITPFPKGERPRKAAATPAR
ncbi:MAG: methanethiol S-methyltransferase [Pseudomonadota bacterium]